ncbi:hypothetical protein GCM10022222_56680 [Amycolatopsis ultiminotia]|uniref:Uncharacterized protein n=1 Tax=Amycolatopsis ultiminotia TaxID=543629 RepID=A0ABP6XEA6_9PSEU
MIELSGAPGVALVRIPATGAPDGPARIAAAVRYLGGGYAIVLTGSGPAAPAEQLADAVFAIARHPRPVVAAFEGDVLGAGYALAAAAAVRVMAGGRLGLGRSFALPRPVEDLLRAHAGPHWARIRAGHTFGPEAAFAAGLVETWCAPEDLLATAIAKAALSTVQAC